jgi:hypothetical protein
VSPVFTEVTQLSQVRSHPTVGSAIKSYTGSSTVEKKFLSRQQKWCSYGKVSFKSKAKLLRSKHLEVIQSEAQSSSTSSGYLF